MYSQFLEVEEHPLKSIFIVSRKGHRDVLPGVRILIVKSSQGLADFFQDLL